MVVGEQVEVLGCDWASVVGVGNAVAVVIALGTAVAVGHAVEVLGFVRTPLLVIEQAIAIEVHGIPPVDDRESRRPAEPRDDSGVGCAVSVAQTGTAGHAHREATERVILEPRQQLHRAHLTAADVAERRRAVPLGVE